MFSKIRNYLFLPVAVVALTLSASYVQAEEPTMNLLQTNMADIARGLDTVWVLIAAFFVVFMQAGFGMLEAGLIRAKNTCNILMKNFLDYCIASIAFYIFGYAVMFGQGNSFMGLKGWFLVNANVPVNLPLYAFWLFQAAFCGAAATIVAGGMAERMKFQAYLIYSFIISALVYPVIGHWVWGGGWLASMQFVDFAGSTVVHAVGGSVALMGTIALGPRIGKFNKDGSANAIPGHSMSLASLGILILWFGWFGFNPGSTLSVGNGDLIGRVALNTNMAGAAGAISAMLVAWFDFGKPDLSMTMNGILAGLVGVTASCAFISPEAAIMIGIVGGVLIVKGVVFLDKIGIDDPVGAFPVHGLNGIWGTLAVGIFGQKALGMPRDSLLHGGGLTQLGVQALGVFTVVVIASIVMYLVFKGIDKTVGLRVSREDELKGLDVSEHGMEAYAGFQVFMTE